MVKFNPLKYARNILYGTEDDALSSALEPAKSKGRSLQTSQECTNELDKLEKQVTGYVGELKETVKKRGKELADKELASGRMSIGQYINVLYRLGYTKDEINKIEHDRWRNVGKGVEKDVLATVTGAKAAKATAKWLGERGPRKGTMVIRLANPVPLGITKENKIAILDLLKITPNIYSRNIDEVLSQVLIAAASEVNVTIPNPDYATIETEAQRNRLPPIITRPLQRSEYKEGNRTRVMWHTEIEAHPGLQQIPAYFDLLLFYKDKEETQEIKLPVVLEDKLYNRAPAEIGDYTGVANIIPVAAGDKPEMRATRIAKAAVASPARIGEAKTRFDANVGKAQTAAGFSRQRLNQLEAEKSRRVRGAIMKASSELQKFAAAENRKMTAVIKKELDALKQDEKRAADNLKRANKEYEQFARELKDSSAGGGMPLPFPNPASLLMGAASSALSSLSGMTSQQKADLEKFLLDIKQFRDALENVKRDVAARSKELKEANESQLKEAIESESVKITESVIDRFGLNDEEAGRLKEYMAAETRRVISQYKMQIDNFFFKGVEGIMKAADVMGRFGVGSRSFFETFHIILSKIWNIITSYVFGIVIGSLQFMLILTRMSNVMLGPIPLYALAIPSFTAVLTFLMGMSSNKKPGDMLELFKQPIIGWIIGGTTVIFTAFILFTFWPTFAMRGLIIALFIVGILIFSQFYIIGGEQTILPLGAVVLVLGYIAFGPYGGYYEQSIEQVREPVKLAGRTIKTTFTDMVLIMTNPTEWYAKQQLQNVRTTQTSIIIEGLEVTKIETIPDTVPISLACSPDPGKCGGQPLNRISTFAVFAQITNKGEVEATDVRAELACKPQNSCVFTQKSCTPNECKLYEDHMEMPLGGKITKGASSVLRFNQVQSETRGTTKGISEYKSAQAKVSLIYTYPTSTSLGITVVNKAEIKRLQEEGKLMFSPVVSAGDSTPAQISLNVGPQPLLGGGEGDMLLLVAVLNSRDETLATLKKGSTITVKIPESIRNKDMPFSCDVEVDTEPGKEKIEIKKVTDNDASDTDKTSGVMKITFPRNIDVKFRKPYFFFCSFRTFDPAVSQTGLITAELSGFEFKSDKSKMFSLTMPLGILTTRGTAGTSAEGTSTPAPLPARLWTNADYNGKFLPVKEPTSFNQLGVDIEDEISSVDMADDKEYVATLYEHIDFNEKTKGTCWAGAEDLKDMEDGYYDNMNDKASSMKLEKFAGAILYADSGYKRKSEYFSSNDASLGDNCIGNDAAKSVKVAEGYTAVLYNGDDYNNGEKDPFDDTDCGDSKIECISTDTINLIKLRGKVSSIRILAPTPTPADTTDTPAASPTGS